MESSIKFDLFSPDDAPKQVPKGWGHELWIVNISEYCAKLLILDAGKRMSWHFHKVKTETFYVLEGRCRILVGDTDEITEASVRDCFPGSKVHVPVGTRHQIIAVTDCKVLEISTPHSESDSFRIIKGD